MGAINPNAVNKFVGDLFMRSAGTLNTFADLGAVRGLMYAIDNSGERIEINSDNRGTILSGYNPDVTIEVEILESKDRNLIAKFFGGVSTDITGGTVTVTDKLLRSTGTWAANEVIYIDGASQDISITNVKNNGSTITNTDYKLVKDPTTGRVGVLNIASAVTITGTGLTTTFTHTAVTAKELVITKQFTEDNEIEVKIQAIQSGKVFTAVLSRARMEAKYGISFSDPTNGGDLKGSQLTFKLQKGGTTTYHDEII